MFLKKTFQLTSTMLLSGTGVKTSFKIWKKRRPPTCLWHPVLSIFERFFFWSLIVTNQKDCFFGHPLFWYITEISVKQITSQTAQRLESVIFHSLFSLSTSSHWTRAIMWSSGWSKVVLSGVPRTTLVCKPYNQII